MCALVLAEVSAPAEAPTAGWAGVGLLARVCPAVCAEVRAVVEALPAQLALVGPLARVRPAVDDQAGALAEALGIVREAHQTLCPEQTGQAGTQQTPAGRRDAGDVRTATCHLHRKLQAGARRSVVNTQMQAGNADRPRL